MKPTEKFHFPELKIISGGQTGADRAALDFAIKHGIPHGGWCPKGRKAEDGMIAPKYLLRETESSNYLVRNERNVKEADATVIFTITAELSGGSKKTWDYAKKHGKPVLHIARSATRMFAQDLRDFIKAHGVKTLNVAGSRWTKEPEVADFTGEALKFGLLTEEGGAFPTPAHIVALRSVRTN